MVAVIDGANIPAWSEPLPTTRRSLEDLAAALRSGEMGINEYANYLVKYYGHIFDHALATEVGEEILDIGAGTQPWTPSPLLPPAEKEVEPPEGMPKIGGLAAVGVGVAVLVAFALIIGRRR